MWPGYKANVHSTTSDEDIQGHSMFRKCSQSHMCKHTVCGVVGGGPYSTAVLLVSSTANITLAGLQSVTINFP